jgi:hypothetical protein
MHGELNHLLAKEHIADLRRAAEREWFAEFAKHESFLVRAVARLRRRERLIRDRAPARLNDVETATGATDAAAAEA